ncbi:MAG: N-acyl homoserine lactonase family protein [Polaromonas sp.]|nr:N-acyl homoserine lactonase family protein [Polaromonas sp.]
MIPHYKVTAIKYATVNRRRKDNFQNPVLGNPDDWMALDFFIWLIVGQNIVVLVDTGFSPASALARQRSYLCTPTESLRLLGYEPEDIQDLVITHLHYDHAGNLDEFKDSTIWVQEREVQFATGKCMCAPLLNHFFSTEDISQLIKRLYQSKVQIINGEHCLHEGIELHCIGGHTDGLQVVRVNTEKGWIVLASDAAHYYENFTLRNPFPAVFNMTDMLVGFDRLLELADGEANIIPGHDPMVCERFPLINVNGVQAYRIA